MKVKKIGQIDADLNLTGDFPKHVAGQFLEFDDDDGVVDGTIEMLIGHGPAARPLTLNILLSERLLEAQKSSPTRPGSIEGFKREGKDLFTVFLFKNKIYLATTPVLEQTSEEEAILLVKKAALSEDNKLSRLRQDVELMERVVERKQLARISIPDEVKLLVFARDEGKCVRCGATERLQFDHIIPVAKGGGNSEKNIQLLCDHCNLEKSDRIAF